MKPVLKIDSVSKKYSGAKSFALSDVSIDVIEGEILALAGESGCGKTTLLRSIAGFEPIQNGEISINDEIVSSRSKLTPAEKRGVSLVFQDLALFPHMSVEKNIAFGLNKLPKAEQQSRIQEVLELTELTSYAQRYPHELSGGQQQRVALARAIAVKPKVLLMDEPFSNLDELLKVRVRSEIKAIIKKTGITTVLVSHDAQDSFEIADRIAILKGGVLQQVDTSLEIYTKPANPYVGRFFGEICVLNAKKADQQVLTDYGSIDLPHMNFNLGKIAFRPEAIKVHDDGDLRGTIEDIIYRGSYTEIVVSGPNKSDHIHIRLNNSTFQRNDRINFSVSPNDILVFE